MSSTSEFRRGIELLIIMNSIFSTGLIEYFIDFNMNMIGIVYACFSIILYVSMIYLFSFITFHSDDERQFLIQITHRFYECNSYVSFIFFIIAGVLRRKRIKRFTLQMETCIRTMEQLNIPTNLSKCFWQQFYVMLSLIFILLCVIVKDIQILRSFETNYWIIFIHFYLYRYPIIIQLMIDFTFVFWLRYIKIKFSQLNELLKSMLTTTIDSPQHKRIVRKGDIRNNENASGISNDVRGMRKSKEDVRKIKKAREIHLEIIKCARNISDAYGLHILFSISTALTLITITSYNMFYFLMTTDYRVQLLQTFTFLYWISYFAIKIFIVSHVCARTATEVLTLHRISLHATNTGDILCELYEPSTSNELRNEIYDFIVQFIQNRLTLTCCGIFDLDYTLIRNVIGTVATYLVILIQIGSVPVHVLNENSTLSTNND